MLTDNRAAQTDDVAVAYAESILVRELVRHALYRAAIAGAEESMESADTRCRDNRILHRASLAQQAYLLHRGASVRAHVFALDPRCTH